MIRHSLFALSLLAGMTSLAYAQAVRDDVNGRTQSVPMVRPMVEGRSVSVRNNPDIIPATPRPGVTTTLTPEAKGSNGNQ
jgi:hypothetical protein